jgi:hypothetical protein
MVSEKEYTVIQEQSKALLAKVKNDKAKAMNKVKCVADRDSKLPLKKRKVVNIVREPVAAPVNVSSSCIPVARRDTVDKWLGNFLKQLRSFCNDLDQRLDLTKQERHFFKSIVTLGISHVRRPDKTEKECWRLLTGMMRPEDQEYIVKKVMSINTQEEGTKKMLYFNNEG